MDDHVSSVHIFIDHCLLLIVQQAEKRVRPGSAG